MIVELLLVAALQGQVVVHNQNCFLLVHTLAAPSVGRLPRAVGIAEVLYQKMKAVSTALLHRLTQRLDEQCISILTACQNPRSDLANLRVNIYIR